MADFTGFYFNDIHSSTYGLVRTSDGDRYKDGLIPEFEDSEIELVGRDGSLYEGRRYKKTEFTIPVAFDNISEQQFRDLRNWLGDEQLKPFRFDERPYKTYWVKLASRPEFDYVCFLRDKEDGIPGEKERVYKGEGELPFVAYDPFGYCIDNSFLLTEEGEQKNNNGINWQALDSYVPFVIVDDNVLEWAEVSGLKNKNQLDEYNIFSSTQDSPTTEYIADLYNPGDFDVDFQLFIDFGVEYTTSQTEYTAITEDRTITLSIYQGLEPTTGSTEIFQFSVKNLCKEDNILIDTKTHSLIVYHPETASNEKGELVIKYRKNLRYDLVKSTDWIKIPKGNNYKIKIESGLNISIPKIKYNYKYY